jgi:hypothetical protein
MSALDPPPIVQPTVFQPSQRSFSMTKQRWILELVLLAGTTGTASNAFAQQTFAYPPAGRTPDQQRQDQYECHSWAVEQSHFDPVQAAPPPQQPRSSASGQTQQSAGSPAGALIGGAARGAALAKLGDKDTSDGAKAGAALGLLGQRRAQASQAAASQQAQRSAQAQQQQAQQAQLQAKQGYEKARGTCLKARGYTLSE